MVTAIHNKMLRRVRRILALNRLSVKYLDKTKSEEYLDSLLQYRQQAPVMDADTASQQRDHVLHLRQLAILFAQHVHRIVEHFVYQFLLFNC